MVGGGGGHRRGQGQGLGQQGFPAGSAPASPAPVQALKEDLTELKDLFDSQLISQAEYDAQRGAIMKKHGMA